MMKTKLFLTTFIFITGCFQDPSSYDDNLIYIDGYVISKETDEPYTGSYIRYFDNGQKEMEGHITDGIRDGFWSYWDRKGQKSGEGRWIDNIKDGKWKFWYSNGNLKSEVTYVNNKSEGLLTHYHENGQKMFEVNMKEGSREGYMAWWHENGSIKSEENFKNDDEIQVFYSTCSKNNIINVKSNN